MTVTADPRDQPAQLRSAYRILILLLITTLVISTSGSSLNIALPVVVDHFHASAGASSWILLSSQLTLTCLTITFGRLSDMFGRRAMFLSGLSTFTVSSLLLGFSPDVGVLIGLRVVQATGLAMVLCNSAAIIASTFSPARLNFAIGVYLSGFAVAQMVGPSVGGIVGSTLGWRWLFWINIPLGVVGILWGRRCLRELPVIPKVHRTIDYLGNGLILASLFSLLLAATSIQNYGIESPWVLGGLLTFVVLFPAFLLVEHRVAFPVVELRIFRQRTFAFANLTSFLISMPRFTPPIVLGLYFQSVLGDSALLAGVKVIPIPVGITIGSLIASRLVKFSSNHVVASAGSIVMSTGFIALIFVMNGHESYWATAVPMFVIGFGSGVFLPTNSTIIIQEAPLTEIGSVNGIRLTLQNMGSTIATAAALTIAVSGLPVAARAALFDGGASKGVSFNVHQLIEGYHLVFVFSLVIAAAGIVSGLVGRKAHRVEPTLASGTGPNAESSAEPVPAG